MKFIILFSLLYLTGLDEFLLDQLKTTFVGLVGRDVTLSGRTDLWEAIFETDFNTVLGTGYSAYWLGERMAELVERFIFVPKQAHNGYIEVYINLGIIGISIFLTAMYSTYKRLVKHISDTDYNLSFQVAFMTMFIIYNLTEATFVFNLSPLWFIFLFIALSNKDIDEEDVEQEQS